ncbi:hypothetical protein ACN4BK_01835 [Corynebacterium macclintockiae]|uniref:hypothetical protein n=1 Tax=Corynebacterium macclintockiae TaxID=2913501 RepID=UPI003EBC2C54
MDPLTNIRHTLQAVSLAEHELEDAVAQARHAGHSWADIGQALNVSRQAAFKRFGAVRNPFTGETMAPVSTDKLPEISDAIIRHISKGEEAETIEMLDPHVREDLPWSVIVDVWTSILTDFGELQEITDQTIVPIKGDRNAAPVSEALSTKSTGTSVVVSTLNHEAGELMSRIAVSREGTVVGVLFLTPDATDYPF